MNKGFVGLVMLTLAVAGFISLMSTGAEAGPPGEDLSAPIQDSTEGSVVCQPRALADGGVTLDGGTGPRWPDGGAVGNPTLIPCKFPTKSIHVSGVRDGGYLQTVCYGGSSVTMSSPICRQTTDATTEYARDARRLWCTTPNGTVQRILYSCMK